MESGPSLRLDLVSLVSLLAGVNLIYVAAFSWLEGRSLLAARLFTALAVVSAWWAICLALSFTDLGLAYPPLLQASQLLSGFMGPLLLLFTLAFTGYVAALRLPHWLILLPGLAGSVSFLLVAAGTVPAFENAALAFLRGEAGFAVNDIARQTPWYLFLQRAHAAQLLLLTLLSSIVFAVWAQRQTARRQRTEGWMMATIYATMLVGIVLTDILPPLGFSAVWSRLAPVLPLPFLLLTWSFLRRRIATADRLLHERRDLLTYLPIGAVDDILQGDAAVGKKVEAAILFCDLRNFTPASQAVDATELVAWIDRYFSDMSECILAAGGMVDKLIGDAVLAVFGVPTHQSDACDRALRTALAMQAALNDLNQQHPLSPSLRMRMGIGIHFGTVVAGSVGSTRRTYTIFGEAVNVGQRIEQATKQFGCDIALSRHAMKALSAPLPPDFIGLGDVTLKGVAEPMELWGRPTCQSAPVAV